MEKAGDYKLVMEVDIAGQFDFDPGRCKVMFRVDGEPRLFVHVFERGGSAGAHGWPENIEHQFESGLKAQGLCDEPTTEQRVGLFFEMQIGFPLSCFAHFLD